MDKEEYSDILQLKNSSCNCLELEELFALRKKCKDLVRLSKIEELRNLVPKYDAKLSILANKGILEAVLHRGPNFSPECKIPISEIDDHDENVITLHCSRCGQQIEVVA